MSSHINVTAVVTVELTATGFLQNIGVQQLVDAVLDFFLANALHLELVSTQLDPLLGTGSKEKPTEGKARLNVFTKKEVNEVKYEAKFKVNVNFGKVGAILVSNEHGKELYVKNIVLQGLPQGEVKLICESWIHSKRDDPQKRVFFTNESYIQKKTPVGLISLRKRELEILRGNGHGMRKAIDRVYDYDVYNDLGDPDKNLSLGRPVLGGEQRPYPRRCRTGRPRCKSDPSSETRMGGSFYIPRDEVFSDLKNISFSANLVNNVLNSVLPAIEEAIVDTTDGIFSFQEINELFNQGMRLPTLQNQMRFEIPETVQKDQFSWFREEEFARETLAGVNPCSIKLVTEWPLSSKLDPVIYGPPESKITTQLVEREIKGVMSFTEAFEQKKLFILDYHDVLLPYVNKVREIKGTTLYGSRTLFFLTKEGTLKPIAIELTRPPNATNGKPLWKQVYTYHIFDATRTWLWRLAKAHVLAHDSAHHQVVSHWLRTHCCVEPYIIATSRELSALHPIYRLMMPYFRYTMEINALARGSLINAGGIIETTFSTERYSMEFGSMVYDKEWRFDHQALPADLISRGMAVEDESSPHGLKLTIEDYPYANDGLLLWDIIKEWVTDYVKRYYENEQLIQSDEELQNWWVEIKTKGHGDKKNEPGWPTLKSPDDLIGILTNMIWVASGHHSAVNFGQYAYGGYFPNRPTIARIKMPSEDPTETEWKSFLTNPCKVLLQTFPSRTQGTKVMTILNVLSSHSPDEEYIGDQVEPSWGEDPSIKASFDKFHSSLKEMERIIDSRNADEKLNNRIGAGIIPYQLLKPYSRSGVTGMGVPNSISI